MTASTNGDRPSDIDRIQLKAELKQEIDELRDRIDAQQDQIDALREQVETASGAERRGDTQQQRARILRRKLIRLAHNQTGKDANRRYGADFTEVQTLLSGDGHNVDSWQTAKRVAEAGDETLQGLTHTTDPNGNHIVRIDLDAVPNNIVGDVLADGGADGSANIVVGEGATQAGASGGSRGGESK